MPAASTQVPVECLKSRGELRESQDTFLRDVTKALHLVRPGRTRIRMSHGCQTVGLGEAVGAVCNLLDPEVLRLRPFVLRLAQEVLSCLDGGFNLLVVYYKP